MATARCIENNPDHPDAALIRDYADLGVSTGYLGGVGVHGDDRSFRVFVRLARERHRQMADVSVEIFTVPHDQRRTWKGADKIVYDTPEVRAKLDKMRAGVAAGQLFPTVDLERQLRGA